MSEPTDYELIERLRNLDHGVCNPIKAKMAREDEKDIRDILHERGITDQEIDGALEDD